MSEQRQRVEAEARELGYEDYAYQDAAYKYIPIWEASAFIAGRTVTVEQVEKAAWEYLHYTFTPNPSGVSEFHWSRARRIVATTLTAAGLLVEGDSDG